MKKSTTLLLTISLLLLGVIVFSDDWRATLRTSAVGTLVKSEKDDIPAKSGVAAVGQFAVTQLAAEKAIAKAKREAMVKPLTAALAAGRQWEVLQGGRPKVLEVALDEVWVEAAAGKKGELRVMPEQANLSRLVAAAEAMQANEVGRVRLVLYPRDAGERTTWNRRLLTESMLVEWDEKEETRQQLATVGVVEIQQPDFAPGLWTARVEGDAAAPLRVLEAIKQMPGVRSVEPLLASQKQKRAVPNDPMFAQQWHLRNTGQKGGTRGRDANVVGVWDRFQGQGISIGIVDDGVDLAHPDIVGNAAASGHFDWNGNDTDPSPEVTDEVEDDHGTAVAGVAAARGNNSVGVSGAAPKASIVGLRLISEPATDLQEAQAIAHLKNTIFIKNNSWGPPDDPSELGKIGSLMKAALGDAATTGRGGKGTLLIWAAGNGRAYGDQSNKDAYSNSRFVVAVGAVTNKGTQSSYSESGANVNVTAPSDGGSAGIVTTDLRGNDGYNYAGATGEPADRNYTNSFGGTSSAAPLVSGVTALLLEANPALSVRDVKEIFLRSSVKLIPNAKDWVTQTGGRPDLAAIKHHHGFGGGMVNAAAAVAMAEDWQLLPSASTRQATVATSSAIPDGTGQVERIFDFSSGSRLRVETVEVTVNIEHSYRGDLQIELVSPKGVTSRLVSATGNDDGEDGFPSWTFSTLRHWGESSEGVWKLVVKDRVPSDVGRLRSAEVQLHGVEETVPVLTSHTAGLLLAEGSTAMFSATAAGDRVAFEWRRSGVAVGGSVNETFPLPAVLLTDAGNYQVAAMTSVGESQSPVIPVSVVRVENTKVGGLEGKTVRLTVVDAGPQPLQYEWRRNGGALVEGVDASGTTSKTLVLSHLNQAKGGDYECTVSDGIRQMSAGVREVGVTLKPVMVAQVLDRTIVSGQPSYAFVADNMPTRFVARGLPPGMRFDTRTGRLTGRPTRPGSYPVRVYAQNGVGRSETVTYEVVVEDLPLGTVNTFRGLVDRQEALNRQLGGTVQLKVMRTGGYTGAMVLAGRRVAFRGLLETQPGGVAPRAAVTVKRANLADLEIAFEMTGPGPSVMGTAEAGGPTVAWSARPDHWSVRDKPANAFAGSYTAVLTATGLPVIGKGFVLARVNSAGGVRMSGRSGNAQPFVRSAVLTKDGEVPMSALIDRNRDSIQGVLEMGPGAVTGQLSWVRLIQSAGNRLYPEGFTRSLMAEGRQYLRPELGERVMQLAHTSTVTDGLNAKINFVGEGLSGAAMASEIAETLFRVEDSQRAFFAGAASEENRASVRLVFNVATGLTTGSFLLRDPNPLGGRDITRRVAFHGVIHGDQAEGCYVIPLLPDAADLSPLPVNKTPIMSGSWTIIEH